MMGVTASAGAQIDFIYVRAQAYTNSKVSEIGHHNGVSGGNVAGGAGLSRDLTNFADTVTMQFRDKSRTIDAIYGIAGTGGAVLAIECSPEDFDASPDADLLAKNFGSVFIHNLTDGTRLDRDIIDDKLTMNSGILSFNKESSTEFINDNKIYCIELRAERV